MPRLNRAVAYGLGVLSGIVGTLLIAALGIYLTMRATSDLEVSDDPVPSERIIRSAANLQISKDEYERWVALGDAAMMAVDAGALEIAEGHAKELLDLATKHQSDWNYGNAIHKGHLVLGRVALRRGQREDAKRELILAARTPGSPQLDTFGPNMRLAKELLDAGEAESVLEYIDLCGNFWSLSFGSSSIWKERIRKGEPVNFGAHLWY